MKGIGFTMATQSKDYAGRSLVGADILFILVDDAFEVPTGNARDGWIDAVLDWHLRGRSKPIDVIAARVVPTTRLAHLVNGVTP